MTLSVASRARHLIAHALLQRPASRIVLAAAMIGTAASLAAAPGAAGACGGALALMMLAVAVIDRRRYRIPDWLTAPALLTGLLHEALTSTDPVTDAVLVAMLRASVTALALLALLVSYRALRGRDGLGLGDVKLGAVAGAWLDWLAILTTIEFATLAALIFTFIFSRLRSRKLRPGSAVPFGLFLAPAVWAGWLVETVFAKAIANGLLQ